MSNPWYVFLVTVTIIDAQEVGSIGLTQNSMVEPGYVVMHTHTKTSTTGAIYAVTYEIQYKNETQFQKVEKKPHTHSDPDPYL